MRIATWNVNSIKQRVDNVVAWLKEREPDVVCLQETKCVDDAFPRGYCFQSELRILGNSWRQSICASNSASCKYSFAIVSKWCRAI